MPGYIVFAKAAVKSVFPGKNGNYMELPFSTKYMLGERDSLIIPAYVWEETQMPDVTQAEVGRRLYHVHREKRVEQAIKLIQQGLGTEWKSFSEDEILLLGHLLQCTWNTIDQKIWDKISFPGVTKSDVEKILSHGKGVGPGKNPDQAAVAEIRKILLAVR